MAPPVQIDRLDHLVMTVADIDATCAFYERVLGMEKAVFGPENRVSLGFGRQKINLHPAANPYSPRAKTAVPGTEDLCFITETPLADVIAHLEAEGVEIVNGPVEKTGATGRLMSVYFRDPDDNLIEVSNYV